MDAHKKTVLDMRARRTMENLEKNRMQAFYVPDKKACQDLVKKLLKPGETVAVGGSESLKEAGILDLLKSGEYHFLDRYKEGLSREEVVEVYLDSFRADTYLLSSNAVTERGELYNVDGNSNRVAALLYGPKSVIVVAGVNKIVRNVEEAMWRVKQTAAPANAQRLNVVTYCKEAGRCNACAREKNDMTDGCYTEGRMCCNYVVSAYQRIYGRIKVVLVGEELGY